MEEDAASGQGILPHLRLLAECLEDVLTLSAPQAEAARSEAARELWSRGELAWKLDSNQLGLYEQAKPHSQFVVEAGRKVGKSYLACTIALETCIRNPGSRVNYALPTGKMAVEIVVPVVDQIAVDAPAELRPTFNSQSGHITFPKDGPAKGAYIVLGGCEDEKKADRLRGPEAVANILDEAGFIETLQYTISSVLKPQTIRTGGKTYLFSSPPYSPGHEFCALADAAAANGAYANRDIYSCAMLTREQIDEYIADEAASRGLSVEQFKGHSDFKREFLAQRVVDETRAVIPEFSHEEKSIIGEHPRPVGFQFVDAFVSLDPGGTRDNSGGLFAYLDFLAGGIVVIEDELLLFKATTRTLAEAIKAKETALWGDKKVRARVVDDPTQRLVADMWNDHQLAFSPAQKDNRELSINQLRMLVASHKLKIHPRCVNLIRQMRNAIHNKQASDMIRTAADSHFDLVAACWYLTREVVRDRNPYPKDWDLLPGQVRAQTLSELYPHLAPKTGLQRAIGARLPRPLALKKG